jgi:hypothetical protein
MKRPASRIPPVLGWILLTIVGVLVVAAGGHLSRSIGPDPLADEVARWSTFLASHRSDDPNWTAVKTQSEPLLAAAREALARRRRLLALNRLAAARVNLAATEYVDGFRASGRLDSSTLETEWTRARRERGDVGPGTFDGVHPAVVRAVAEAAQAQAGAFVDASREYGRATAPEFGLFYLGSARGARELATLARSLHEPGPRTEPAFRSIAPELDSLGREMLAAYRPPLSLDHHPEFIVAHAALKEARELDAAGLRRGALLRYLQARVRYAPLRDSVAAMDSATVAERLTRLEWGVQAAGLDHSIARMLLEIARGDLESAAHGTTAAVAVAIVTDVLPHYFSALEPPRFAADLAAPRATVTLVRWPYT